MKTMDAVGDAQRRLPIEVQRAMWKVEAVADGGLASDYPTRCQQQAQRECARDALALAIEAHVASASSATGHADAALDEARERIEALERQARMADECRGVFADEQIEAAAQRMYFDLSASHTRSLRWSLARDGEKTMFRAMARRALEAAFPRQVAEVA